MTILFFLVGLLCFGVLVDALCSRKSATRDDVGDMVKKAEGAPPHEPVVLNTESLTVCDDVKKLCQMLEYGDYKIGSAQGPYYQFALESDIRATLHRAYRHFTYGPFDTMGEKRKHKWEYWIGGKGFECNKAEDDAIDAAFANVCAKNQEDALKTFREYTPVDRRAAAPKRKRKNKKA